jgi:hypothetical protein
MLVVILEFTLLSMTRTERRRITRPHRRAAWNERAEAFKYRKAFKSEEAK